MPLRPGAALAAWLVAVLGATRAGALGRPRKEALRVTRRGAGATWMRRVSEDVLVVDGKEEAATTAAPGGVGGDGAGKKMSGWERARLFNRCKMEYHAPAGQPMPLVDPEAHAVYFLEPKAASSPIRGSMGPDGVPWPFPKNLTLFTFVRDPAQRLISAFLYKKLICSKGQTNHRGLAFEDPRSAESRRRVLGWFEEFLDHLMMTSDPKTYCWDTHVQGQRNRLPDPAQHPMDFIGDIGSIWEDWQELQEYQKKRFHTSLGDLKKTRRFSATTKERLLLNASIIPGRVMAKICGLYRDEYCCFGYPLPKACHISCTG